MPGRPGATQRERASWDDFWRLQTPPGVGLLALPPDERRRARIRLAWLAGRPRPGGDGDEALTFRALVRELMGS